MTRSTITLACLAACLLGTWAGCGTKGPSRSAEEDETPVDDQQTTTGTTGSPTGGSTTGGGQTTTGQGGGAPVTPGTSACCEPVQTPGCSDATLQDCVCKQDSYCCESAWDATCVSEVNEFGCGKCDVSDNPGGGGGDPGGGGGDPGGGSVGCKDDGQCTLEDDCVCTDCDADSYCSDPANCQDDGKCDAFVEGCVCADCKSSHPECAN
jgi:predicted small lipoprotein YifL